MNEARTSPRGRRRQLLLLLLLLQLSVYGCSSSERMLTDGQPETDDVGGGSRGRLFGA
jgi:hypothetical protein